MKRWAKFILPALACAGAVSLPLFAGAYPLAIARSVFTYMALAVSWDMLVRSGQISFGIAGLFGVGAYAAAIATLKMAFPPLLAILFGGLFAALVAFALGFIILRLRHTYFSITTLALAEIFRVIMHNWTEFTGGAEGLVLSNVAFGGKAPSLYLLTLAAALAAIGASVAFERSRMRLALTAMRDNELSARSSGINIFRYMLIAFVASAFLQGIVGGVNFEAFGYATPDSVFDANYTLLPLAMALLGGMYSTWGPVLGSILLGVVSEWLKLKIPYGHLVVYGIIIVLVILFMPDGLYGMYKKARRAGTAKSAEPAPEGACR